MRERPGSASCHRTLAFCTGGGTSSICFGLADNDVAIPRPAASHCGVHHRVGPGFGISVGSTGFWRSYSVSSASATRRTSRCAHRCALIGDAPRVVIPAAKVSTSGCWMSSRALGTDSRRAPRARTQVRCRAAPFITWRKSEVAFHEHVDRAFDRFPFGRAPIRPDIQACARGSDG